MSLVTAIKKCIHHLPFISLITLPHSHARSTGSIALYSDPYCAHPLFVNNYTLGADVCGDTFTTIAPSVIHSYIVNKRPSCSNGSAASYVMYTDLNCKQEYQVHPAGPTYGPEREDGSCKGMVDFEGMAFICNGFGNPDPGNANGAGDQQDGYEEGDGGGDSAGWGYATGAMSGRDRLPYTIITVLSGGLLSDLSTPASTTDGLFPFPSPRVPIPIGALTTESSTLDTSSPSAPSTPASMQMQPNASTSAAASSTLPTISVASTSMTAPTAASTTPSTATPTSAPSSGHDTTFKIHYSSLACALTFALGILLL